VTTAFSLLSNYMDGFEPPITEGSEKFCLVSRCANISDCVQTVYELPLLPNNTAVILASLCSENYVHIHTYLAAYRLYMNYRCYQITLQ
jgi:hypothetical protein